MIDIIHRWALTVPAVHPHDIARLLNELGIGYAPIYNAAIPQGASESAVQQRVRMAAAADGVLAWRNNSGALMDDNGNIGINNELITERMVGLPRGQFWARECKPQGWKYTGTEREVAQLKYGQLVISYGGDFAFTTGAI